MVDLTVVLTAKHVDSLPQLRELLKVQAELSRVEPGCLRFEAFESQTVAGMFFLVERWESQQALDTHRAAPAVMTNYIPKVLPLVDRVPHICESIG